MKSNKQLKYSNYAAISHFHGTAVNNLGLMNYLLNKVKMLMILLNYSLHCLRELLL